MFSGVIAGALGCGGGGSKYKITEVSSSKAPDVVRLAVRVVATGAQDPLDSAVVASTGAGCAITKARAPLSAKIDTAEGKCGEMAVTFYYDKSENVLIMACPVAVGVEACKSQFSKILGSAQDARYIK